jgi:hypothetical protein
VKKGRGEWYGWGVRLGRRALAAREAVKLCGEVSGETGRWSQAMELEAGAVFCGRRPGLFPPPPAGRRYFALLFIA